MPPSYKKAAGSIWREKNEDYNLGSVSPTPHLAPLLNVESTKSMKMKVKVNIKTKYQTGNRINIGMTKILF